MTSMNLKLALSAVAIAMLATPALAARAHQTQRPSSDSVYGVPQQSQVETYPNGATRTGSAASEESGADFNLLRQPD